MTSYPVRNDNPAFLTGRAVINRRGLNPAPQRLQWAAIPKTPRSPATAGGSQGGAEFNPCNPRGPYGEED